MPTEHSGFVTERVTELKDLRLTLHQLRHKATGARFVHLANDDQENVFGVGFRTTPLNSTGVAHILEHSVQMGVVLLQLTVLLLQTAVKVFYSHAFCLVVKNQGDRYSDTLSP